MADAGLPNRGPLIGSSRNLELLRRFANSLRENIYVDTSLIVIVGFVLFGSSLSGDWRWDDPQILLHAHQYSILSDFTDPEVWQQFSPANLTPWLIFSFEVDLILFGVNPTAFYLHQVLALIASAIALYALLTLWADKRFAFFGALLFLAGAPSFRVVEQLMTRHYVEGLLFCLLSLICFVRFLRSNGNALLLPAAAFYLLAVIAKEIYVPLVLLIPLITIQERGPMLRSLWPYCAIAGAYILWRGWMLDSLVGGYVESSEYLTVPFISEVISSFSQFPKLILGNNWLPFCMIFIVLVGTYARILKSRLLLSSIVLALVLIPLVPLVRSPGIGSPDRYFFLFWCSISFAMAFYAGRLGSTVEKSKRKLVSISLWIVAPLTISMSLWWSIPLNARHQAASTEYDVQAQFIWQEEDDTAFLPSPGVLPSFWFVTGLQDFKSGLIPGSSSPSAIVDAIYLEDKYEYLYQYDRSCLCMKSISDSLELRRIQHKSLLREQAPLSLEYSYQDGIFSWEFGPYTEGNYHVVSDVIGVIPAPLAGRLRVTLQDNAPFYLKYTAPEGWITYSEEQRIQKNSPTVNWMRD